ncbi:MAG: hypothetical protein K9K67_16185 [Bacteriovoracaceae bacterium]|nr:hypothetical protein [Bacteriovoracaceae bacterium]
MSSLQVNDPRFFDYQGYLKYKRNIWDPIYKEGLYFSAMEELGQELIINIGIRKTGEEQTSWFQTPHALHDGYSALKTLAKEQRFSLNLPPFNFRPPISINRSILSAIRSTPKENHQFKNQSEKTNSTDFHFIKMAFPLKTQKYSDTAYFSKIVCQTLMKFLTNNTSSRWMVPVRLRDADGLQASYFGLEIKQNDTVLDLHKRIVLKLRTGEHWGFYYLSKIGLVLGKRAIIYLTKKNVLKDNTIWMGVISNLGNLGDSVELNELTVLVPVRWHRPVGVVIYKHNGKQILTVTFHKSLKGVDTDEILREIHKSYL